MGVVALVHDGDLDRRVALKLLHRGPRSHPRLGTMRLAILFSSTLLFALQNGTEVVSEPVTAAVRLCAPIQRGRI